MSAPTCEMVKGCTEPVAYLDEKGFIYCTEHGQQRQSWCRCRKMRSHELNRIRNGQTIERY